MITGKEILEYLDKNYANTVTVFDSVTSTNEVLKELAAAGKAADGDCVIADFQTQGKGRLGRRFESPKGKGLYFSMLFYAGDLSAGELSGLTPWGAVATARAIEEVCGVSPAVKWVNDLVYGTKKLCGILTELIPISETDGARGVIMGIGINVNQTREDYSEELKEIAVSLREICGKKINRAELCAALIRHLREMYGSFPARKRAYLAEYRARCIVPGKTVTVIRPNGEALGEAVEIDESFRLVVRLEDGTLEALGSGEISLKGFYGL